MPVWNRDMTARIRHHLQTLVRQREGVMIDQLKATDLPQPKIDVTFFNPMSDRSIYLLGRILIDARSFYLSSDSEILCTIDHEIAHYVQDKRNRHIHGLQFIRHRKAFNTFTEGFATFAARITTGNIGSSTELVMIGALTKMNYIRRSDDYVVGYSRFKAIAKANSADFALHLGLEGSLSEWEAEAEASFRKLGVEVR